MSHYRAANISTCRDHRSRAQALPREVVYVDGAAASRIEVIECLHNTSQHVMAHYLSTGAMPGKHDTLRRSIHRRLREHRASLPC